MLAKKAERKRAIKLRKQGLTYSEINKTVRVSSATLSLWLRYVPLTTEHQKRIAEKSISGRRKAADLQKSKRIKSIHAEKLNAINTLPHVNSNVIFFSGIMLYWAEGNKQKENNISQGFSFNNSDPKMIKFMHQWLLSEIHVQEENITYELYLHTLHMKALKAHIKFWSDYLGIKSEKFAKIYEKKQITSNRAHSEHYHGLVRLSVKKSTNLNRRISAYTDLFCKKCGIV